MRIYPHENDEQNETKNESTFIEHCYFFSANHFAFNKEKCNWWKFQTM